MTATASEDGNEPNGPDPFATSLDDSNDVDVLANHEVQSNVIDALVAAGVTTIGDLRTALAEPGKLVKDVKGVGEATETALRELFSPPQVEEI